MPRIRRRRITRSGEIGSGVMQGESYRVCSSLSDLRWLGRKAERDSVIERLGYKLRGDQMRLDFGDPRLAENLWCFRALCDQCRGKVVKIPGKRLFELTADEWGLCDGCIPVFEEHLVKVKGVKL